MRNIIRIKGSRAHADEVRSKSVFIWDRCRSTTLGAVTTLDPEVLSISPSSDSNAERSSARQNRAMSAPVALHAEG